LTESTKSSSATDKKKRPGRAPVGAKLSPRTYHHGDLRSALLDAALKLIDAHGVKGFSLKDAAKMAGVSVAAPYRHFVDKNALLGSIQIEGFRLFNAALAAGYANRETAAERLEELGVAYVLFALENPAYFRVMFGMSGGGRPEGDEASGFLLLVEAVRGLNPNAAADLQNDVVLMAWSVVHGFAMLQMEDAFVGMTDRSEIEGQLRRTLRLMVGMHVEVLRG
jgi:AcrR family transcriptional regulator